MPSPATLPALGASGKSAPLVFLGSFCVVAAVPVVALVRDPARAEPPAGLTPASRVGSPYRQPVLWRIHAASALLVVPQFTVATFALVYLVDARGWTALAAAAAAGSSTTVPILLACAVVAVSTNGLAFTAVAEYAGTAWAGRALGVQNTGQNGLAAATPPVLALAIGAIGYGASFAAVAAFPLVAAVLVPVVAESGPAVSQPGPAGQPAAQGMRS